MEKLGGAGSAQRRAISRTRLPEEEARFQAMQVVKLVPELSGLLVKLWAEGASGSDIFRKLKETPEAKALKRAERRANRRAGAERPRFGPVKARTPAERCATMQNRQTCRPGPPTTHRLYDQLSLPDRPGSAGAAAG